jgi:hypothetical protein
MVDALPAPFSLAQQWVGIVWHCWISMVTSKGILAMECTRTLLLKFFLRMTETGTAFQNLYSWHLSS